MWVPSQDQFSATPRQMRRAANPTDTPPRGLDGLLEGVASKEANSPPLCLSTTAGGVHCATTTLWYWRRASVVYPDVPVLAVPSRHRPARTAGHNRTKRYQTTPQVTYKHIMELARNRQVGGSSPPSGSTDTPIDLRFCRLSARSGRVVVSWCIRGASISTRCVPAVPVHSSSREGPKATASVISKRLCGGRRSPFDQQRPQVEPSGSPRANGSRSGMIPAMPQVRALGRIHSRWEHQRPARSPGHLVIEGVFRCR